MFDRLLAAEVQLRAVEALRRPLVQRRVGFRVLPANHSTRGRRKPLAKCARRVRVTTRGI